MGGGGAKRADQSLPRYQGGAMASVRTPSIMEKLGHQMQVAQLRAASRQEIRLADAVQSQLVIKRGAANCVTSCN